MGECEWTVEFEEDSPFRYIEFEEKSPWGNAFDEMKIVVKSGENHTVNLSDRKNDKVKVHVEHHLDNKKCLVLCMKEKTVNIPFEKIKFVEGNPSRAGNIDEFFRCNSLETVFPQDNQSACLTGSRRLVVPAPETHAPFLSAG